MPIDFDLLFAPFRTAYRLQWRSIGESLRKLADWVMKRLDETRKREIATRAFQTFTFEGSALVAWLDPAQHGALGPVDDAPPQGLLQTAAAPFQAFWRGLLLAPAMVRSELALPRMLDAIARFVDRVNDSLERFAHPDASMFDVRLKRDWQDLFGELGLFFRLVNSDATVAQVEVFSRGGLALKHVLARRFPSAPDDGTKAGGPATLAALGAAVLGASLALPLALQLAAGIATTALTVVRVKMLASASAVLDRVLALRREAIDLFYVTLFDIGRLALERVVIMQGELLAMLTLYAVVAGRAFAEVTNWLKETGKALKPFMDGVMDFLRGLGDYLELFLDVDLGGALDLPVVSFKLGDILDWREHPEKAKEIQDGIDDWLDDHPVAGWLGEKAADLSTRLQALREVIGIAATRTPFPDEATPPLTLEAFPDISRAFFRGGGGQAFKRSLENTARVLRKQVDGVFDAGIAATANLGDKFSDAAAEAARLGSARRYGRVAQGAATLAETAFGADAMRADLRAPTDPLAQAFESWLAGAAFQVVEKALPGYARQMVQFWKTEADKDAAQRPTSPHILARRAALARVKTPRLVIRVNAERKLDKTLAAEIGDRVRAGVAQAFGTALAAPAGA